MRTLASNKNTEAINPMVSSLQKKTPPFRSYKIVGPIFNF